VDAATPVPHRYAGYMTKTPTPDEAVEHAQRIERQRVDAVRTLAHARAVLSDLAAQADEDRKQLERQIRQRDRQAEKDDLAAYNAALKAGWTEKQLATAGFPEPRRKARNRRRTSTSTSSSTKQPETTPAASDPTPYDPSL